MLKVFEKRPMFYNGIFGCHGNIYYVICFGNIHSIGPVNVCTNFEINHYKIAEFRKHAKSYVLFDVT